MSELETGPSAERGRMIVKSVTVMILVFFAWMNALSIDVALEHGLNNPTLVGRTILGSVVQVTLIITLLVCLYRGYGWARWLGVAGMTLGSAVVVAGLLRRSFSLRWLLLAVLFAAGAFLLVLSPDVREFYCARRAERRTL